MSTQAGWYPDPSGAPGMLRYWDGVQWTPAVRRAPSAPPLAPPPGSDQPDRPDRRRAVGWWLAAGAVVVVLALVVVGAVRLGRSLVPSASPGGQASTQVCPPATGETPTPVAAPTDGRVHGGKLSFPQLSQPFGDVLPETEVPFARDVHQQLVLVQSNFDGRGSSWVATVMVGDLYAGDGFFSPQDGARIVVDCVIGRFYGDAQVTRHDVRNAATTIDGHEAWLVESKLSFDINGLRTKGELLLVAIVRTGPSSSGIFYASIPDTTPELVEPARQALAGLRVDG
ncbi:DUF2510 domain-containing protein [Raineyella fluvialis]|uniref:DUF2510 domain-containing protein n=1 Tax=Raineyella fluvialis TaxID=2662261 RepID=UPI00188E9FC9|nr:DUF2510 domain-containing protein [Raineyella fluvialis]